MDYGMWKPVEPSSTRVDWNRQQSTPVDSSRLPSIPVELPPSVEGRSLAPALRTPQHAVHVRDLRGGIFSTVIGFYSNTAVATGSGRSVNVTSPFSRLTSRGDPSTREARGLAPSLSARIDSSTGLGSAAPGAIT